MKPLRIFALNYRCEVHSRSVYNELASRGHRVTLYSLYSPIDSSAAPSLFCNVPPREQTAYLRNTSLVHEQVFCTLDLSAARALLRARPKPDVVVSHGLFFFATPVLGLAARSLGIPVVAQTFLRPFKYESCRSRIIHSLRRAYFRNCAAVIAAGDATILGRYGVSPEDIFPLQPFTDFGHRSGAARADSNGRHPLTITYVGQLFHLKGVTGLVRAYITLIREFPDLRLCLVGGTPSEGSGVSCESEVRRMLAQYSLRNAEITGWLPRSEVEERLAGCDIFAFPSLGDTYPKAVMEAMAAGLPIVMSDACGSVGALAAHGRTAWIFPAGDVSALAEALRSLLRNPELRRELASNARAAILKATPQAAADVYEASFRHVCE